MGSGFTIARWVIYTGLLSSKEWGISLRQAQHEPLISVETFNTIQERLAGKILAPARADIHTSSSFAVGYPAAPAGIR